MTKTALNLLIVALIIVLLTGFSEKRISASGYNKNPFWTKNKTQIQITNKNNSTEQPQSAAKDSSASKDDPQIVSKSASPLEGYGISPEGVVTFDDTYRVN